MQAIYESIIRLDPYCSKTTADYEEGLIIRIATLVIVTEYPTVYSNLKRFSSHFELAKLQPLNSDNETLTIQNTKVKTANL